MRDHRGRPLALADEAVVTFQHRGACCWNDWLIGVDEAARAPFVAAALDPPGPPP